MKTISLAVSFVLACMLLVGPIAGCGGKKPASQPVQVKATTKGQELEDLNSAYKKGIITEKEHEQQKEKILNED